MSLRTRRGLALWASIFLVAAACTQGTQATPVPTTPAPAATPAEPTPEPVEPTPEPVEPTPGETTPGESPVEPTPGESPVEPTPGESPATGDEEFEAILFDYEYTPEAGTPGGAAVISDWQAANQLNPYYSNAFANSQVYAAAMRGLAVVTSDGHWKEDLAASLPRFSDGTIREETEPGDPCPVPEGEEPAEAVPGFEVDLALKPGLMWSDAEPLDLNDLAYTWSWVMDPEQVGIVTLGWDKITSFEVTDDGLGATVRFCEPYAGYFGLLMGSPLLPQHYMETVPVADAAAQSYPIDASIAEKPVSGPFRYVTASPDTIELERNPNWMAGDHEPYLERLTYRFFPDNKEGMIAAFLTGEIDVAVNLLQGDYDAIAGVSPDIGVALLEPAWEYEHLDLNQRGAGRGQGHPALQDEVVRKAMAGALNLEDLWNTVFPGQPLPDVETCTNAPPGTYWRLEGVTCEQGNPEDAAASLEAAGYIDTDGDGIREMPNGGEPLDFVHCTSAVPAREIAADYMAGAFRDIGIALEINVVDSTTVYFASWPDVAPDTKCNLARGNYDTAEFAYVLSFDLFGNYYYSYHSEQIPTDENDGNGFNYLRFSNPEMDEALDTLASAIRPADALEAAYTVQEVFVEQQPEIVQYYRASARGVSTRLQNFFKNPSTSSDMWNVEDWFVIE